MLTSRLVVSLILVLILASCSKKEPRYSVTQIMNIVTSEAAGAQEVFIADFQQELRVICENYGEGCVGNGKRLRIRGVDLLMIEFANTRAARQEALKLHQWYVRNWLLDDVTNEPILESFVKRHLNAKNPHDEEPEEKSCGWFRKTC